jgi:hypothetical protein
VSAKRARPFGSDSHTFLNPNAPSRADAPFREEVMSNRHTHKKLRAEARARMVRTGESYQLARQRILSRSHDPSMGVDLVPFRFFGVPMTLATAEGSAVHSIAVLSATPRSSRSYSLPLAAWLSPRGVN